MLESENEHGGWLNVTSEVVSHLVEYGKAQLYTLDWQPEVAKETRSLLFLGCPGEVRGWQQLRWRQGDRGHLVRPDYRRRAFLIGIRGGCAFKKRLGAYHASRCWFAAL